VSIVLERQHRILDTLHAGLRRALLFLSDHYAEPVSLTELSEHAHVSASHLTFLFRNSLGLSFKSFLLCLRIHTAQQLLRDSPLRITEVAMRAGFADLSHFERCFRRAVGQSARDYRRAMSTPP
jgi:transcriptional regulator GlxA family with amidase domain